MDAKSELALLERPDRELPDEISIRIPWIALATLDSWQLREVEKMGQRIVTYLQVRGYEARWMELDYGMQRALVARRRPPLESPP